jgi:hypothetical protein
LSEVGGGREVTATYKSRPIKRARRSKADVSSLRTAIYLTAQKYKPLSVRNLFYRLVVAGVIDKTQAEYKNTVVRLCGQMREDGELPWSWIVDDTRWMHKPDSYNSLGGALQEMQRFYRRNLWQDQDHYCEFWCESGSAGGMIYPATSKWDCPLMAAHGFASKAFCWNTAKTIEYHEKPAIIFYVGDYDPSGVHIDRDIESKLRRYAPESDITFKRIAVLSEQIEQWDLPSAPPKKTDSRARSFDGQCVEVEAIPPDTLLQLVDDAITSIIDQDVYQRMLRVEAAERKTLDFYVGCEVGGDED